MAIKNRRFFYLAVTLALCGLLVWWWTGGWDKVMAQDSTGRAKAQAPVAAYAKHVGVHDALHQTLDAENERAFGDFGFQYLPKQDVLQAKVYIIYADPPDGPKEAEAQAKVDSGMNDPKIGGMYDRGGGYFVLDHKRQAIFLFKDYSISTTEPSRFIQDVDNLRSLGWIWLTSWGPHAARQSYGAEPLPTQRITREHNPYGPPVPAFSPQGTKVR